MGLHMLLKLARKGNEGTRKYSTDVRVIPGLAARIRAFFSPKVSAANCGSSFTSILYCET